MSSSSAVLTVKDLNAAVMSAPAKPPLPKADVPPSDCRRRRSGGSGPVIISVEAAIGTGKSTLLRLLERTFGSTVRVVQEPVDTWQSVGGKHNLLEAYYADQERYAFSFQTNCVLSRIRAVQNALENLDDEVEVVVLERCWSSDRSTFTSMLHDQGKISDLEWALYEEWYGFACRNAPTIDGHLYLECSPETCMSRLRRRDRTEEVGVTKAYQEELIRRHEAWLSTLDPSKVCRIAADTDFVHDESRSTEVLAHLQSFVTSLVAAQRKE